jgi:cytochrome b subunit of formate dehydrogenase
MTEQINEPSRDIPLRNETSMNYTRFHITQRIEHIVLMISFTILGITGLAQKFFTSPISQFILRIFGGIESTRHVHHIAAIILLTISGYHIIAVLYRIIVLRVSLSILPGMEDFIHLFQDIGYYLGLRDHRAFYGRYTYAEKVEYFAVVWGTLIMAITGFIMWNPISTSRWLSGEYIPAAKAAHGGEAVLAVLAIILWHFYNVHLRNFNKSMFTGKLTLSEMEHEHPGELLQIETGQNNQVISPQVLRKRQIIFIPTAAVISLVSIFSLYKFTTFEKTAISTVHIGENASIYVPITPTPRPSPTSALTTEPMQGSTANTWTTNFEALFRNRCKSCHINTSVGGLSLATYESALKGGKSGPAIVPGNPDASILVQIQSTGKHPGQLTIDELNQVIEWIKAGAPEN